MIRIINKNNNVKFKLKFQVPVRVLVRFMKHIYGDEIVKFIE